MENSNTNIVAEITNNLKNGDYVEKHIPGLFSPIEMTCFIVPNSPCTARKMIGSMGRSLIRRLGIWGIKANLDDTLIQVWLAPKDPELLAENDNWTDHGCPKEIAALLIENSDSPDPRWGGASKIWEHFHAPAFLPLNFIKDIKEGETKTFLAGNQVTKVAITFEQLPHRYRRFGKFEDVVADLAITAKHMDD